MRPEFSGERDLHYGVTQMMSCLAATQCWFNSRYNLDSFIDAARRLLASMPDAKCPDWVERIEARSRVMPLPLELPTLPARARRKEGRPLVVWNHRWEYDKAPERLFAGVDAALDAGLALRLAVVGERFKKVPACFAEAKARFEDHPLIELEAWGFLESRADYWELLGRADLVVSTAKHEFFGISMMEAAHAGADLLVPDDLAYVELFPDACRYPPEAFGQALCDWLRDRDRPASANAGLAAPYAEQRVLPSYRAALNELL
jgi:glycosyltransferase involved in cell wall biosynthesis